jgi:hypothetical protein
VLQWVCIFFTNAVSAMINSRRRHHWLTLAGLDRHKARAVEGQLEELVRAAANEVVDLEGALLDLRLQVRRPVDPCRWFDEGRLLRVAQTRQQPVIGAKHRLILRRCLVGAQ